MISLVVVCLALSASAFGLPSNRNNRIVGGLNATEGQFPYVVSLRTQWSWENFCAGSILNNRWIITSANCVVDKKPHHIHISVGSVKLYPVGQKHDVYEIFVHEDYNPKDFTNDIALLKLMTSIEYNENVQPIQLSESLIGGDVPAVFGGWGWLTSIGGDPTTLQYLNVKTVDFVTCKDAHEPYPIYDQQHICTLAGIKHGACDEDGGAGLVIDGQLVGVFAWLRPCAIGYPDVFTRISTFVPWIHETMKK